MKDIVNKINESKLSERVFLVLHTCDIDNIREDYYFWTNLPEEDVHIINYHHVPDKLKEILEKKFPKIWKKVDEISKDATGYNSKAKVWVETFPSSKIKNL